MGRHLHPEDPDRLDANTSKEQVTAMINSAPRNVLSRVLGMLQYGDFLPFERDWIESPDDALALRLISGRGIVNRVPPPGSYVIKLAIAGEYEPAAMVDESVFRDAWVALLRDGSQILNTGPLALVWPDAH